jgi:hypothetical protein
MSIYSTQSALGCFGVDLERTTADAEHAVGVEVALENGGRAKYVQADGAITGEGYVCVIDEDGQADMINTTNSASAFGQLVGVAQVAFADNEYGWLVIEGETNVRVAASCAANVAINTTGSDGVLDDDATSGAEVVDGIILTAADGGSGGNVVATINNKARVGATIA